MRCTTAVVAGLGVLALPGRLPHRAASSVAWCPRPLHPCSAGKVWAVYLGAAVSSAPAAAFVSTGGSASLHFRGRTRRDSATTVRRRVPYLCAHRKTPISENGRVLLSTPSIDIVAIVLEIQRSSGDADTLAVYGRLHCVLGAKHSRRLLGPDAVATLTSLNYLIVQYGDGGPSLPNEGFNESEKGGTAGGARLGLGDRCWDICGIGQRGPTTDCEMQRRPLFVDQRQFEREIESVVTITSRSEVFTAGLNPAARPPRKEKTGEIFLRSTAREAPRKLRWLYTRTRSVWALDRTRPSFAPSSTKTPGPIRENPLLRVGLGALMSRSVCDTIRREAEKNGDWAPWDGDFGEGAVATGLENLPLSRALWDGKVGKGVRARIAGVYGVSESSVVLDVSRFFVCKVGADADGGRAEAPAEGEQGRRATRRKETVDQTAAAEQQQCLIEPPAFTRSRSLITFWVTLSAEDALSCSWAVCLEQRGVYIRPVGQGSGVIFSGKLRHASVRVSPAASTGGPSAECRLGGSSREHQPVLLLRGFASIRHPSVLEESAQWQWGSPAWHVDAPWVKDQDILDRVWVARGSNLDAEETGGIGPPPTPSADRGAAATGVAEAPGSYYLQRMNTTLAHRYYRQGLAGMHVPVVDTLGRPVIDLVEDGGVSLLSPLLRGIVGTGTAGDVTLKAVLRRRYPWGRRREVGKAGMSTEAGASPLMDAALRELFGPPLAAGGEQAVGESSFVGVPVPPIKYVFVDPRYRGLGLGRRLFLEAMRILGRRGFRFALIVVEDNGSGSLFGFYEEMGFVRADKLLGLPRAMIAPIPPPSGM